MWSRWWEMAEWANFHKYYHHAKFEIDHVCNIKENCSGTSHVTKNWLVGQNNFDHYTDSHFLFYKNLKKICYLWLCRGWCVWGQQIPHGSLQFTYIHAFSCFGVADVNLGHLSKTLAGGESRPSLHTETSFSKHKTGEGTLLNFPVRC